MKTFIIIYDPINGHVCPDGKVAHFIEQCSNTLKRDCYLKTTIGNSDLVDAVKQHSNLFQDVSLEIYIKGSNNEILIDSSSYLKNPSISFKQVYNSISHL